MEQSSEHAKLPLKEMIKSIPGVVGIRLEEKPKFDKLGKEGDVQLRRYHPMLVAEVTIRGDHATAVDKGFDILAKYIFGENSAKAEMSMTNPVLQEQESAEDTTLEMTAPVFQEREESGQSWRIAFVIPAKFTLETVPKPLDKDIQLVEIPAATVAVVEYSGNNTEEHMEEAATTLKTWLLSSGRLALSPIRFAQYDAPFTIPFLKRNEAQMDVRE